MDFIGRAHQVDTILDMLDKPGIRLITLSGPAGVGKTRLAYEVIRLLPADLPATDVSFATLHNVSRLPTRIAEALEIAPVAAESWEARIINHLRDTHTVLLLDNLEHLLPVPFIPRLLAACPNVRIIATSRVVLHLSDEHMLRIPPLDVPAEDASLEPTELMASPAVQLFVQRARRTVPGFQITTDNAEDIATIVRSLDGLPLALELAAGLLNTFGTQALRERLHDRLALLVGGPVDRPEHQRTLRSTIDWSYQLMPESQQRLFRRLGVLNGSVSPEMALAVCGEPEDTLAQLIELADRSLVQLTPGSPSTCSLLETMHIYARNLLDQSGECADMHVRLAAYCLDQTATLEHMLIGENQAAAIDAMDALQPNIRAAMVWLRDNGEGERYTRMACALFRYWRIRGILADAEYWLEPVIKENWALSPATRAQALAVSGWIALERGRPEDAQHYAEQAITIATEIADARVLGQAWRVLSLVDNRLGNVQRATERMEQSLAWYRKANDADGIAGALNNLAILALDEGAWERVITLCEESTASFRELGNVHGASHSLDTMGIAQYELHRYDDAMRSTLASLKIDRAVGDARGLAVTLDHIGKIARAQGDLLGAWEAHAESVRYRTEVGDPRGLLVWLQAMAHWLVTAGRAELATRILGAIEISRTSMNLPLQQHESADHAAIIEGCQRALGEDRFHVAIAKGRWASLDDLTDEAITAANERVQEIGLGTPTMPDGIGDQFGLTDREEEVLRLLTRRLSDKEIADHLCISARTVNRHVSNVLAKLDVNSRREAASIGEQMRIG
ncbi:MAG: LuxR C-terminal-related transcriptional regulator [Thermomicrobiales bacterium]|nr:LuxR C-terminal-related transcriptional regulator [Thermomicrobiales bacterium]